MKTISMSQANDALGYISPDLPRDEWWKILAAVKSEFGDGAYSLALDWSQSGDTFKQADFDSTWRSLSGDGVGIATLVYHAKQGGWSVNLTDRQAPPPKATKRTPPPPTPKTADYAKKLWSQADMSAEAVSTHPYPMAKHIDKISVVDDVVDPQLGPCNWPDRVMVPWAAGVGRGVASGSLIGKGADCIIVPMRTIEGDLTGVQCINAEGKKQSFGKVTMLALGNTLDPSLTGFIVEGWATGAYMMSHYFKGDCAIYIAFSSGCMDKVARQLAEHYPNRQFVIGRECDE